MFSPRGDIIARRGRMSPRPSPRYSFANRTTPLWRTTADAPPFATFPTAFRMSSRPATGPDETPWSMATMRPLSPWNTRRMRIPFPTEVMGHPCEVVARSYVDVLYEPSALACGGREPSDPPLIKASRSGRVRRASEAPADLDEQTGRGGGGGGGRPR